MYTMSYIIMDKIYDVKFVDNILFSLFGWSQMVVYHSPVFYGYSIALRADATVMTAIPFSIWRSNVQLRRVKAHWTSYVWAVHWSSIH